MTTQLAVRFLSPRLQVLFSTDRKPFSLNPAALLIDEDSNALCPFSSLKNSGSGVEELSAAFFHPKKQSFTKLSMNVNGSKDQRQIE